MKSIVCRCLRHSFFISGLFLFFFQGMPQPCIAEVQTGGLVRVGYTTLPGMLNRLNDGRPSGIAYELLQEIAICNNWSYEFIECNISDAGELLNNGAIDIFVPIRKTEERCANYDFSQSVFTRSQPCLLTLPSTEIYFNDFEHMDGITVGTVSGTINDTEVVRFLRDRGCSVTIRNDFGNQREILEALGKGSIDALVSSSNRGISRCKKIAVLDAVDSYVIAKKGNKAVLDKMDYALSLLLADKPTIRESLYKKYLIPDNGSYPALTKEDVQYITQKKSVTVLISSEECDSTGAFKGSAAVLFNELTELTGLSFVPIIEEKNDQLLKRFVAGEADTIYSFNYDFTWADMNNAWLTDPYAEFYNQVIFRTNSDANNVIATAGGTHIDYYVRALPNKIVRPYSSYKECIEAVLQGEADVTYCTSVLANYYSTFPKYSNLSFLPTYNFQNECCLAVSKKSDKDLVHIINKSIICIPESVLLKAFEIQTKSLPATYTDFFYMNPILTIVFATLFVFILTILICAIFYCRMIYRKNQQLKIANDTKSEFMSRMSHDMRTPMGVILGLIHTSEKLSDLHAIKRNLNQIKLAGQFLLKLINDTLTMNKVEAGKLELHIAPTDTKEVMKNVLVNANLLTAAKGIQLNVAHPLMSNRKWPLVLTDGARIEQIALNIISNAVKFTPQGGRLDLIMETVAVTENTVIERYIIRDTGIGMSKDFLAHIFDPFAQEGRGHTNPDEGTGLGMTIVKQLIVLLNGEISIKSELNKGTEVTLLLEYEFDKSTQQQPVKSDNHPKPDYSVLSGAHLLLCEDHPMNAEIAKNILNEKGCKTTWMNNGKEGLQEFERSPLGSYDAILMDIRMPVMNGLEAAAAIRNLDRADAAIIPIIAMTANAYDEDIKNSIAVGMNAHLAKPIEPEQLFNCLAELIKSHPTKNVVI